MTNLPQQDTIKQYVADGAQTTFVATFFVPLEIDGEPDLDVYVTPAGQSAIPESDIQVWGVDFTYSPNLDPITGGTVTFEVGSVPAVGDIVTLVRNVSASLDVEFSNAQTFSGTNLDDALDKLLLIEQQNKTYCLQRNLSYVVNTYIPDVDLEAQVQIPILGSNQIWKGTGSGVVAVTVDENPDVNTLRSELASELPVVNGAHLVGYYDVARSTPTTVKDFLDSSETRTNVYTDTGAVNAVAITVSGYTAYALGDRFYVKIANTNTANGATFNINGIGAGIIYVANSQQCYIGDLQQAGISELVYNGTNWYLINPNSCMVRAAPCASVSRLLDQTVPGTGVRTLINFDVVNFDPYSMWNNTSKRFVAPWTGLYRVGAATLVSHGNAATTWDGYVFKNGVIDSLLVIGNFSSSGTPDTGGNGSVLMPLTAGDYVDFQMQQAGGTDIDLRGSDEGSYFEIEYLGR